MKKKLSKAEKIRRKKERHLKTKSYAEEQEKRLFNKNLKDWKAYIKARDNNTCQKCGQDLTKLNENGKERKKDPHHIISLQSVKRKFPELNTDINNGILLCTYCHKNAPDSPHQGGFEFTRWLKENKPEQYVYLNTYLNIYKK